MLGLSGVGKTRVLLVVGLRSLLSCRLSVGGRSAPGGQPRSLPHGPSVGPSHFQTLTSDSPVP